MIWWEPTDGYLMHHGIKGMKWGIRRYQNPDGSLTAAGKARYNVTRAKDYAVLDSITRDKNLSEYEKRQKSWDYRDRIREERINKVGKDLVKDIKEGSGNWDQVTTDIYFRDFSRVSPDSKAKQAYDKSLAEVERINEEHRAQLDRAYDEFMANKSNKSVIAKAKQFLKGSIQEERVLYNGSNRKGTREDMKAIRKIVDRSDEAKKLNNDYAKAREAVKDALDKLEIEYKQVTLDKILKSVPKSKRDAVYDLIYNEYWDYDDY